MNEQEIKAANIRLVTDTDLPKLGDYFVELLIVNGEPIANIVKQTLFNNGCDAKVVSIEQLYNASRGTTYKVIALHESVETGHMDNVKSKALFEGLQILTRNEETVVWGKDS